MKIFHHIFGLVAFGILINFDACTKCDYKYVKWIRWIFSGISLCIVGFERCVQYYQRWCIFLSRQVLQTCFLSLSLSPLRTTHFILFINSNLEKLCFFFAFDEMWKVHQFTKACKHLCSRLVLLLIAAKEFVKNEVEIVKLQIIWIKSRSEGNQIRSPYSYNQMCVRTRDHFRPQVVYSKLKFKKWYMIQCHPNGFMYRFRSFEALTNVS